MTFLEICKRYCEEADIGVLSTTEGLTAGTENHRVVNNCQRAYADICKKYRNWKFLRSAFTVSTVADTQAYAITACSDNDALNAVMTVAGFSHWWTKTFRIYKSSDGIATQRDFPYKAWGLFRDVWLKASPASNFPTCFTVRLRDSALLMGATPNAVYVVTGEYQRRAPVLNEDDHEPLFQEDFHDLILWWAIVRYAGFEEDSGLYDHASREKIRLMADLELDQLPTFGVAGSLC